MTLILWLATVFMPPAHASEPGTVVIFTAGYGGGHDSPMRAIEQRLRTAHPGLRIEVLNAQDYFVLADRVPRIAAASTFTFNKIYQHVPALWDPIYERTLASAAGKTSAGDIPNPLFRSRRIMADLERIRPDVIYSTFHIMTSKLIGLRESGDLNPAIPIAWLDTDFTQHPFYYLHSLGADLTFLAHPALRRQREDAGVPAHKMATTGLFIDRGVFTPFTPEQRREFVTGAMALPDRAAESDPVIWINGRAQSVRQPAITLDPDVFTVILSSGRAGVGNYPVIAAGLITEARRRGHPIQIVAVCGENQRNFNGLTRLYERLARAGDPRDVTLVASHLVDNAKLVNLVRSADLFIGKSGSLSPFEAAAAGVPRVLIDVIGGQERWVANFFREQGLAEVVPAREQHLLAARAFAYLDDPARMAARREADQVVRDSYDLTPITKFYEDAMATRTAKPPVRPHGCDVRLGRARGFPRRMP